MRLKLGACGGVLFKHTVYLLYGRTLNVPDLVMRAARFKSDGRKTDLLHRSCIFVLRRKAARGTVTYIAAD